MQTEIYDAQGNLISSSSPGSGSGSGGSGGSGSGTPGAPGKDGTIFYSVDYEPTPGMEVTGYNPQDFLLSPAGVAYSLKSA